MIYFEVIIYVVIFRDENELPKWIRPPITNSTAHRDRAETFSLFSSYLPPSTRLISSHSYSRRYMDGQLRPRVTVGTNICAFTTLRRVLISVLVGHRQTRL